jgi:hypothetical protein
MMVGDRMRIEGALRRVALVGLMTLAACAGHRDMEKASYPALLPLDAMLASVPEMPETDPAASQVAAAAALRARAEALRQQGN